jgi:Zn-dependent protease with chaperone function
VVLLTVVRVVAIVLAACVGVLAVLFLLGILLSRLTLRQLYRSRTAGVGAGGRLVRSLYRVVIGVTSVGFYASVPFFDGAVGRRDKDPGRLLTASECPQLWSLTSDVARRMGVRPVERIYITPGTEIAVMERGRALQRLRGNGWRCLLLGLGALPGLRRCAFEAILAHEYGHFSNRDTAGGNLARQVLMSMQQMEFTLAMNGLNSWYNPAWVFINSSSRIFRRVSSGASRLQEILADRNAALAYGVKNITEGLEHMVRRSLLFGPQVANEIERSQRENRRLHNLYTLPPLDDSGRHEDFERKYSEAMAHPASPYDTHPPTHDRIALLRQLDAGVPADDNSDLVWDLFDNTEALQAEMTRVIQENVDSHKQLDSE